MPSHNRDTGGWPCWVCVEWGLVKDAEEGSGKCPGKEREAVGLRAVSREAKNSSHLEWDPGGSALRLDIFPRKPI